MLHKHSSVSWSLARYWPKPRCHTVQMWQHEWFRQKSEVHLGREICERNCLYSKWTYELVKDRRLVGPSRIATIMRISSACIGGYGEVVFFSPKLSMFSGLSFQDNVRGKVSPMCWWLTGIAKQRIPETWRLTTCQYWRREQTPGVFEVWPWWPLTHFEWPQLSYLMTKMAVKRGFYVFWETVSSIKMP